MNSSLLALPSAAMNPTKLELGMVKEHTKATQKKLFGCVFRGAKHQEQKRLTRENDEETEARVEIAIAIEVLSLL